MRWRVWVLGGVVLWAARRWWRVASSVEPYRLRWKRRELRPGELTYAALGDSLAQGIGASDPERGYVGLLAARLERETGRRVRVRNLSRSGVRVADVLRDQVPELLALDPAPALVTVSVGTNDAGKVPAAELRATFGELCAALPAGTLVADVPRFHRGRRAARGRETAALLREVLAGHPHLVPVGLDEVTRHTGLDHRAADLFHPNDRGHARYAETFWRAGFSSSSRA
ncbi:MAG TPA: SGNH/GDSL hydrolase family protein [Pseudonocardiaceae bacterium]